VLQVAPPGLAVTVYPVTAAPPLLVGADQLTVTLLAPKEPRTEVGAPGTVESTTVPEVAAAPEPALLMASTVKTYELYAPIVRKTQLVLELVQVRPPGLAVTRYELIVPPPSSSGAVQVTVTSEPLAAPVTPVGAPGTAVGVRVPVADAEFALEPALFVALTQNMYVVPFVKPATVQLVVTVVHVADPGEETTV